MGTKNNPGNFDCYTSAESDEPMFVLLGRDPMAGWLVRRWAEWRQLRGEDEAKVLEARQCATALDAWAQALGKTPLSPTDPPRPKGPRVSELVIDELVEACARAAHEVNRAYCLAIGDGSQLSWDSAPDWQRISARNGVSGALAGSTPEQSHESWLAEKAKDGWKYGPIKNATKKEHPCFVPYAELPPAQRAKDELFVNTVRTVAKALGR
jgi:RyR domain